MTPDPRAPVVYEIAGALHRTLADLAENYDFTQAELLAALADVLKTNALELVAHERQSPDERKPHG